MLRIPSFVNGEKKNYQNDFEQKGEEYFGLLKHLFFLNPKLLEGDF